jgi:hypothetical protein
VEEKTEEWINCGSEAFRWRHFVLGEHQTGLRAYSPDTRFALPMVFRRHAGSGGVNMTASKSPMTVLIVTVIGSWVSIALKRPLGRRVILARVNWVKFYR